MPNGMIAVRRAQWTSDDSEARIGLEAITQSARRYSICWRRPYVGGAHQGLTRSLWCQITRRRDGVRSHSDVPAIGFGSWRTTQSAGCVHKWNGSEGQIDTDAA